MTNDIRDEACKFIVEILDIRDDTTEVEMDCKIIEILKNKNDQAAAGDEFNFGISNSTLITIWKLEEIEDGLKLLESYEYIGPKKILNRVAEDYKGREIKHKSDVENWIKKTDQKTEQNGLIIATFVIEVV